MSIKSAKVYTGKKEINNVIVSLLVFLGFLFCVNNLSACSLVFDREHLLLGRTMDFYDEDGAQIYIFPKGIK